MKILITGATGFIGSRLTAKLTNDGHEVIGLSRNPDKAKQKVPKLTNVFKWDALNSPAPQEAFDGVEAVIHLAGDSVFGRWTDAKKKRIYDSRIVGTQNLLKGLEGLEQKPEVLISASAVGYYGDSGDETLTEESSKGEGFLTEVCVDWEAEARKAEKHGLRVVLFRIGLVLGQEGGALPAMLPAYKLCLGGPIGSGQQWWSWIHIDDITGMLLYLLENDVEGPVNAVAPTPERQKDFATKMGQTLSRPAFIPIPAMLFKIALGESSVGLFMSQKVIPDKIEKAGYNFNFTKLENALKDLLKS